MGVPKQMSAWQGYVFALVLVIIVASLRALAEAWIGNHYAFMVFLLPVIGSVWYGGMGAGLLAIAGGITVTEYGLLAQHDQMHPIGIYAQGRVIGYTLIAVTVTIIISKLRAARLRAEDNERKLQDQIEECMRVELSLREQMGERQRVEAVLKETLEKAETASRAKSEFLTNMSHEIRTPMNAVVGIADILAMGVKLTPEKYQELLSALQLSAKAMMAVIDDLLDISKIENERVELEKRVFNLHELVEGIVSILGIQACEKQIALTLEYDERLAGRPLAGDTTRLRQILMNLLGNAVKFTEHGGVTLRVYECSEEDADRGNICFEVVDTGIGIQEEKLETVFNKFSQADTSITRKFGGTGLGLAISKKLVEMMGGTLSVASKIGIGSLFRVTLPLSDSDGVEPGHSTRRAGQDTEGALERAAGYTLLIVEDNTANVLIITTLIGYLNYACKVARNGIEAIAMAGKEKFDLILMDIQMPGMDGYRVTEHIREHEKAEGLPATPIIGVSAHALSEDRAKCFKSGMDDYISKPFNPADLQMKIAALLHKHSLPGIAGGHITGAADFSKDSPFS